MATVKTKFTRIIKLKFSDELTVMEKANHNVIRAVQSSMSNRRHSLMIT